MKAVYLSDPWLEFLVDLKSLPSCNVDLAEQSGTSAENNQVWPVRNYSQARTSTTGGESAGASTAILSATKSDRDVQSQSTGIGPNRLKRIVGQYRTISDSEV